MDKFSNVAIAELLREVAAAYEISGEDRFRIRAYDEAANSVERTTSEIKDLWEEDRLQEIPGIGPSIAQHLDEYFRTGRARHFDAVKKGLPEAIFALLPLPGIGAKRAARLAKELKLKGRSPEGYVADLKKKVLQGKVRHLEGFGEKSEAEMIKNILAWEQRGERMLLPHAAEFAAQVLKEIRKDQRVSQADFLGSLRRQVATVGDVDIAVASSDPQVTIDYFTNLPKVDRVLSAGGKKASVIWHGRQVDVRAQKTESYGALLQYFTGSKNHNIHLRKIALEMGYSLSEYGIKSVKSGRVRKVATEEEFYKVLKMVWIPPELREDTGEIEASQRNELPTLVSAADIRGDLHLHSNWSDGELTIEQIAEEASGLGYQYIGIVDHQPSVKIHGLAHVKKMLDERSREIKGIGQKVKKLRILNGIEVSIYVDRSLALSDELLSTFDFVIASVHTSLRQSKAEMTQRILSALANPHVSILGHPTGRMLPQREGYEADWSAIFEFCAKNNKFLEINAFPARLDLPDTMVKEAKSGGVKFVIGSDAHQEDQLANMPFGVAVARRGWCEKRDILNTLPCDQFLEVLKIKSSV